MMEQSQAGSSNKGPKLNEKSPLIGLDKKVYMTEHEATGLNNYCVHEIHLFEF